MRTNRFWTATIFAATMLAVVAANGKPAMAAHITSFTTDCLINDSALKTSENITTAPVTVTITPGSLQPPNHKLKNVAITASLAADAAAPVNLTIAITDITDDQVAEDDTPGNGCGKPSSKQGADWSPTDFTSLTTTGSLQLVSDAPLAIAGVMLRAERCGKLGTRTYSLAVTCTDNTNVVSDTTAVLQLIVPKNNKK